MIDWSQIDANDFGGAAGLVLTSDKIEFRTQIVEGDE